MKLTSKCLRTMVRKSSGRQLSKELWGCLLAVRRFWRSRGLCLARLQCLIYSSHLQRFVHRHLHYSTLEMMIQMTSCHPRTMNATKICLSYGNIVTNESGHEIPVCSSLPLHVSCNEFQTLSPTVQPTSTLGLHDHPLNMSEFETFKCGIYRRNADNIYVRSCQRTGLRQTARPSNDPKRHSSRKSFLYFLHTITFRNYWKKINRNESSKLTNSSKQNSQSLFSYCIDLLYHSTMNKVSVWLIYLIFYLIVAPTIF